MASASPENPEVLLALAMSYERQGDNLQVNELFDQAWEKFLNAKDIRERVAKLDPADTSVQYSLALSSMKLGLLNLSTRTLAERNALLTQSLASLEVIRIQERVAVSPAKILIERVQRALDTISHSAR